MNGSEPIVSVDDLVVRFRRRRRDPWVYAVNHVSLEIQPGETVGLVGESGSGKSTLGRALLGLVKVDHGTVRFDGADITHLTGRSRRLLSDHIQAVFQDPSSSLNPSFTVARSLAEPMRIRAHPSREELGRRIAEMLDRVGLSPALATRYPAQFSGGQLQRIAIGRALMTSPKVVVCDESVSALDLSAQAQVLNLLQRLQQESGVSFLFISHDLGVVRHICQQIVVMFKGQVMESGSAAAVSDEPAHPYTQALQLASPQPDPRRQREVHDRASVLPACAARIEDGNAGCPFAARCPMAMERCAIDRPALHWLADGRRVACHLYEHGEQPDLATPQVNQLNKVET